MAGKGKKSGKQRAKALKARAERRAAKYAAMKRGGQKSDYAIKKAEQANGHFRPTSPFTRNPMEMA